MKEFIKNRIRESLIMEKRVKFKIPVPQDIIDIKDVFVKNGHKLFVVGGAVRDALLGKSPKDWDLATDAVPDKVEEMMKAAGLKTIPTGKQFGVINVFSETDEFEIATFRKDIGAGRRPDEVEFTTIEQDVKRRDLTINALFFDIDTGEVVDLVGGVDDLKNGVVKTVGKAEDRFGEDRLRILRAVRFAGRFGSELDPEVEKALLKDSSLEGVSGERIRDEFLKGLKTTKSVIHFLNLNDKFGLLDQIFNGLDVNKEFIEEREPAVQLAWLLVNNDPTKLAKDLNKLKFSANEVKAITFLVALTDFRATGVVQFKKLQMKSGVHSDLIKQFARLINFNEDLLSAFLEFQLSVTGQDAENAGIAKGPDMGSWINNKEVENFQELLN
jgi:tRNA nucleotidyltransferase/poly(A) polymerase